MELLIRGANEFGLPLRPDHIAAFQLYYRELVDWNSRFNLTAIVDPDEVQVRHFLDSLTCLLPIAKREPHGLLDLESVAGRAVDVGAGAGLPGIPLKIVCPHLELTLLESVHKKAAFLTHVVEVLHLAGVNVVPERAEDAARSPSHRGQYDYALARALAPLPILLEYCLPFLKTGGLLIAPKKGDITDELAAGDRAGRILGGRRRDSYHIQSGLLSDDRFLVLVDKVRATPAQYPRRAGAPAKRPLGLTQGATASRQPGQTRERK